MAECLGEGICWCSNGLEHLREAALDQKYPDRCRIVNAPDAIAPGERYCVLQDGHDGPCYCCHERPGDPCHWCGTPTPLDRTWCKNCWQSTSDMSLADLKAAFATVDLSIDLPAGESSNG